MSQVEVAHEPNSLMLSLDLKSVKRWPFLLETVQIKEVAAIPLVDPLTVLTDSPSLLS